MCDVIKKGIKRGVSWEIRYADDVVLINESKLEEKMKADEWCVTIKMRVMRISRKKTKYIVMTNRDQDENRKFWSVNLEGRFLNRAKSFKCLKSIIVTYGKD